MMREGSSTSVKTRVKRMMAQPQLAMPWLDHEAQDEVERLGDEGPATELDERLKRGTVRLAVGADGVDRRQHLSRLGAGEEAQAVSPLVSPTAMPSTWMVVFLLLGSLGSVGKSMALCSVTTVVRLGDVGQESRGKVKVHNRRVLVRLVERVVSADLGRGKRVLFAIDGPCEVGRRRDRSRHRASPDGVLPCHPGPQGQVEESADRRAVLPDLGLELR